MREITSLIIDMHNLEKHDFMGYRLDLKRAQYHHIQKKCNGGKLTFENGAILDDVSHRYLHTIENYRLNMYLELNRILKAENGEGVSRERIFEIYDLLDEFQYDYDKRCTRKGHLIVKPEYKTRMLRKTQSS